MINQSQTTRPRVHLVDSLRQYAKWPGDAVNDPGVFAEAADEIEQLRTENAAQAWDLANAIEGWTEEMNARR